MRRLVWFALGFALSCGLGCWLLPSSWLVPLALTGAAFAGIVGWPGRPWKLLRCAAVMLLGCAVGLFWFSQYHRIYLDAAGELDGSMQMLSVRTTDYSQETDYGISVSGTIELDGKRYQLRVYLEEMPQLEPGAVLEGNFLLRLTTPGGSRESSYLQGRAVFLLAYQRGDVTVRMLPEQELRDYPARLRHRIQTLLTEAFPADTAPFARALLLGDTSGLDYQTDSDFKISGIRHVIAVSGLHVSILFALLSAVTFRKRYLTALLGFPLLLLFAAAAGLSPSVVRACIMSGLMLLALLSSKEYDGPTALAFAVLVMLAANPLVIGDAGFQLSAGSVAGIFCFQQGISKWLTALFGEWKGDRIKSWLVRWFAGSVSVTLSAMAVTAPLCALYFGTVSLIGVVTNLAVLWVISLIFYGLMAVCLLTLLSGAAGIFAARLISWPIRYVLWAAKSLAGLPLAAVYTHSVYIVIWLVFVYVLLFLFLISRNRRPVELGCCAAIGLCIALLASWVEPALDDVRLTVLDVGQGQCILLQSEGKTFLVDCGGDSDASAADRAAAALLSRGITELDGVILTHLDRDHAGAVENLLHRVDTKLLILPPEHCELALATKGQTVYAEEDLLLDFGSGNLRIYTPTFPGTSNENSLCVLFDTEKCDILITGDRNGFGERMLLRNADISEVDVLIAGHHGSKHSTCEELLAAVRPETVCISAGADNPYGHPAQETLERLAKYGCAVYRTDLHGDILIRR